VKWKIELSVKGRLSRKYSCQKLLTSNNPASS